MLLYLLRCVRPPFKLSVDASDAGAGAVLLQEGDDGVEHPDFSSQHLVYDFVLGWRSPVVKFSYFWFKLDTFEFEG